METIAEESALPSHWREDICFKQLVTRCSRTVVIIRNCGHKSLELSCSVLLLYLYKNELPPCQAVIGIERSCGRMYETTYCRRSDPAPICHVPVKDTFSYPCGIFKHSVKHGTCHAFAQLRALENPICATTVKCARTRCTHHGEVPCRLRKKVAAVTPGRRLVKKDGSVVGEAGVEWRSWHRRLS